MKDTDEQPDEELYGVRSRSVQLGCATLLAPGCASPPQKLSKPLIFMRSAPHGRGQSLTHSPAPLPFPEDGRGTGSVKLRSMARSFQCPAPVLKLPTSPPKVTSLEQKTLIMEEPGAKTKC